MFLQIVCFLRGDTFVNSFGKIYVNICPNIVFRAVLIFCRFSLGFIRLDLLLLNGQNGRDCWVNTFTVLIYIINSLTYVKLSSKVLNPFRVRV